MLLPELNLKNSVYLFSKTVFHQLKKYSKTQEWPKTKFMKSYWSEDPLEFLKFANFYKISSMEKNQTDQSTQMKLLLMELPFKPQS